MKHTYSQQGAPLLKLYLACLEMGVCGIYSPEAIRFSALKAYVQAKSIFSSLNTVVPVFTKLFEKI